MTYNWTGLTPIKDGEGNVTGFRLNFSGRDDQGNYINGSGTITIEQFTASGGDVAKLNELCGPLAQTLIGAVQA